MIRVEGRKIEAKGSIVNIMAECYMAVNSVFAAIENDKETPEIIRKGLTHSFRETLEAIMDGELTGEITGTVVRMPRGQQAGRNSLSERMRMEYSQKMR